MDIPTEAISAVTGLVGATLGVVGARLGSVSAERVAETAPYADMARRVERLERREDWLTKRLGDLRIVIALHVAPLIAWIDAGAPPPPPTIPEDLRDLLSSKSWIPPDDPQ